MDSYLLHFGSPPLGWQIILLSLVVAFLCSSAIGAVYQWTFQGLSWSRGMMHSMVLGSVIACLLMIAIGDNVARGIGIVGSLAIIRFRTNLRDPRDLVFLFAALGVGVASGVQSFAVAALGAALFSVFAVVLNLLSFGSRNRHDGLLRFQAPANTGAAAQAADIMQRIPKTFALVTMRSVAQDNMLDYAYQVKLRAPGDTSRLVRELEQVQGIRGISYMNQHTTVEL